MNVSEREFVEKARSYWTKERTEKVTGAKKLLILPGESPLLLRIMGLLNHDASMSADSVRKYRQINHMIALISMDLDGLAKQFPVVRFVDLGCGNSYVTLLAAWYFKEKLKHPFEGIGIDNNASRIAASQKRAVELNFDENLRFLESGIANVNFEDLYKRAFPEAAYSEKHRPHMTIALHACDTATDHALCFAVKHKSDFVAVAPCCQAELAQTWKDKAKEISPFGPIFRSHHFRREMAADMTDVMRMLLMRAKGYEVTATEFVGVEHTPKNRLLVCTRRGLTLEAAKQEFASLKNALSDSTICLESLLLIELG